MGLLACVSSEPLAVMLDALLHAGPILLPDCLIPEPTNCPSPDLSAPRVLRGSGEEQVA